MHGLHIAPYRLPPECEALRAEVRAFLAQELAELPGADRARSWTAANPEFSCKLGARGWIGLSWPRRFGGRERPALERYVVVEELLAAGAPVAAHWAAERQSALLLMRHSPDQLAPRIVPSIARGETYFCIGMSEPDSGSDLASIRTRATRSKRGWIVSGRKVWISGAHYSHYMICLVRTASAADGKHAGLSQLLIDMRAPGVSVRPIENQLGEADFNEVELDDVCVPPECLIGTEGNGWQQATAELAFERSGPERYLSSNALLLEMIEAADPSDARQAIAVGRLVAAYAALRQMSLGVAGMLARGEDASLAAALVKDQGALVEQSIPEITHDLYGGLVCRGSALDQTMSYTLRAAPSFSLRGGTREILRGVIARGLGLR